MREKVFIVSVFMYYGTQEKMLMFNAAYSTAKDTPIIFVC